MATKKSAIKKAVKKAVAKKAAAAPKVRTTTIGYVSKRGQVVIRGTGKPGTDHGQKIYQLGCSKCGHVYGANGSDIFEHKCPKCQGGHEGLAY